MRLFAMALSFALAAQPCLGADDMFKSRPAFSGADLPAESSAKCDESRAMSAGIENTDVRIDLTVIGELTAVKHDGVLWYLLMCSDVRVLCATYESNGMKVGDRVIIKGGYKRLDPNHAMLDPCLANLP